MCENDDDGDVCVYSSFRWNLKQIGDEMQMKNVENSRQWTVGSW